MGGGSSLAACPSSGEVPVVCCPHVVDCSAAGAAWLVLLSTVIAVLTDLRAPYV